MKWPWLYDINGPDGTLYLRRFTLLKLFGWKLLLHRIARPDYSRELHDHPWSFITVVLRGGYVEQVESLDGEWAQFRANRPGRVRFNRLPFPHRVTELINGDSWSLVIHGPDRREWGFYTDCGWMPWQQYCDRVYKGLPPCEPEGKWEAIYSSEMWRVRWSIPDAGGRFLWVRHYDSTAWGKHAAERNAEAFNTEKRSPWEFESYRPRPTAGGDA